MPVTAVMVAILALLLVGCAGGPASSRDAAEVDPFWRNATIYFILTDRFNNGDPRNDHAFGRQQNGGVLRSFEGGDIAGVTAKIEEGYFNDLGIDALWLTPLIENTHGAVVEEGDRSYAYHGYWPLDWSAVDPNFGSEREMAAMIEAAHRRGIRVIADVILNHTGPVTDVDPAWPAAWVREGPRCDWSSYAHNVSCVLASTLQDIRTESDEPVELPLFLVEKWRAEGRLATELAELDAFFARTGYPRAPKYYVIKWLTDWVRDYGIDAFRVDTAKHIEPEIWAALEREARLALAEWRAAHPDRALDDRDFYMFGELFNYGVLGFERAADAGRAYDYGDRQVDFYDYGFSGMINMGFAAHAREPIERQFQSYSDVLHRGAHRGVAIVNYISSHDDGAPYDAQRTRAFESATRLLLTPGSAQIYYGDEIGRPLVAEGARGDANLRSTFDWRALQSAQTQALLAHWRKLGRFRQMHPAVGAGVHQEIQAAPFVFARTLDAPRDRVVVAIDMPPGRARIPVSDMFVAGTRVCDAYGGDSAIVADGHAEFARVESTVLIAACS